MAPRERVFCVTSPACSPVGRLHHVVLDARDPLRSAEFWSLLLGLSIAYVSDDWVVVAAGDQSSGLAFQLAPDHLAPVWGDPLRPQQIHHDVMVDDVSRAETEVAGLGATRLPSTDGSVWADPAGHPFCLIPRPSWARPVASV